VRHDGREVGRLVSASYSPRLQYNMGYVWVPIALAEEGTVVEVMAPSGTPEQATVMALPFLDPKKDVPKAQP
jgi:glycine cleavage system aminomethyltransferase T